MRRFCAVLLLALVVSSTADAEDITVGFKGGLNLADLTGESIMNNEMKPAFGGGIFFNYAFSDIISVQPEILFMMKGTKHETIENMSYNINYFDIPVLAKLSVPTEGAFVPSFFAGPSFGLLVSAKEKMPDEERDVKEYLKTMDIGLVFGAGADYKVGNGCIILDFRYSFGLTNILDDAEEYEEMKTQGITFLAGYGFYF